MRRGALLSALPAVLALTICLGLAQYRTARDAPTDSLGTPDWSVDPEFKKDVFTFVRIGARTAPGAPATGGPTFPIAT